MSKLYRSLVWTGFVAVGVAACGDDVTIVPPPDVIRSVTVAPDGATIQVGQSLTFTAAVTADPGVGAVTIAWSSSNAGVASINAQSGVATGVSPGTTAIKATATAGTAAAEGVATLTVGTTVLGPPTVSISAITTVAGTPVPLTAVVGQINVGINLERNGNAMERLDLLMDTETGDSVVASQSFTGAPPAQAAAEGAELVPELVVLSFNTAHFTTATGAVSFRNRLHTLRVRAFIAGQAAGPAASNSVQMTLANVSGFQLTISVSGASANDPTGLLWRTGDVSVTAVGVIYTGQTVTAVTLGWPGLASKAGPTATWAKATAIGSGGSASFQSPAAGDVPSVVASVLSDGTVGPTAVLVVAPAVPPPPTRVDNLAPAGGTLVLATQGPAAPAASVFRCCSNNWVGKAYGFATGHAAAAGGVAPADAGVGLGTVTYHVGATALTNAAIAALPATATGNDATPTTVNTAVRVVARVPDRLDNVTLVAMTAAGINPLATVGIDHQDPTAAFAVGSVAANAINPAAPWSYVLSATDDVAGFSATPTNHREIGNFTSNTGAQCVIGAFAASACNRILGGLTIASPSTLERYFTFQGNVWDQGGNASADLTRTVLQDVTPPTVSNVAIPASLVGGAAATFTAALADNVDLLSFVFSLDYTTFTGAGTLPFAPADVIGVFGEPRLTSATASATVTFVRSIEFTTAAPGDAPSGTLEAAVAARFLATDVATNTSTQFNTFAAGTVPAGTGAAGLGVATFLISAPAAAQSVNNGVTGAGAPVCAAGTPGTRNITVIATGAPSTFANPFASVRAYRTVGGVHHVFATATTATVSDDGITRTWTWTLTLNAAGLASQAAVPIFVIGVDAAGDGLVANTNTNISICNQS